MYTCGDADPDEANLMPTIFRQPPLIEIIAELRWARQGADTAPLITLGAESPAEGMFSRWTDRMGALGYEHVERLVPQGFPLPVGVPTLRVRQRTGAPQNTLFQIGPQIFTANATPPYLSWKDFAPTAQAGVLALLAARPESEIVAPFQVSLRYIDAFREPLIRGLSPMAFLTDTLGVAVEVPPAIARHGVAGAETGALVQFNVPLADGKIRVQFGEGRVGEEPALIMDMTLSRSEPVPAQAEAIMHALSQSRDVTHAIFMELTAPIAALMQPEQHKREEV